MKPTPEETPAQTIAKLLLKCLAYETALQKIKLNSYASSQGINQMVDEALHDPLFVKERKEYA